MKNQTGVRYVKFHDARDNLKLPAGHPGSYVVSFGALADWQGIDILLDATQDENWPEEVSLLVMGNGSKRAAVKAAAKASNRVKYLGVVPYREAPAVVAGSLASVCPMTDLGGRAATGGLVPLKLFEALACGVPVIVTDFPAQAGAIREHHCGIVVPPGNPAAIASAVRELFLCLAEAEEMGRRGWRAAEAYYSWDARAAATEPVIARLHRGDRK